MESEYQNKEIISLANENIFLATQVILAGKENKIVEQQLIHMASEFNGKSNEQKINCIKTLIFFNEFEKLKTYTDIIIVNKYIQNIISFEFDTYEIKSIIKALNTNEHNLREKKNFIKRIMKRSLKRGLSYDWEEADYLWLENFILKYSEPDNIKHYMFYISFDIPGIFIKDSMIKTAYEKIENKNKYDEIIIPNFIKTYDSIDHIEAKFIYYLENNQIRLIKICLDIILEIDRDFISTYFRNNSRFKAYVFCMLNSNLQYDLAIKHGIYYFIKNTFNDSNGELPARYRPKFFGLRENELSYIKLSKDDLELFKFDIDLKSDFFIGTYHIIEKKDFNFFLNKKLLNGFPILIWGKLLKQIQGIMSEANISTNIRIYLNRCIKNHIFQSKEEFIFPLLDTSFMAICIPNIYKINKKWYLKKIIPCSEIDINKKFEINNFEIVQNCSENLNQKELIKLANNILNMDIVNLCYLASLNIDLVNCCLFCRLRYNEQYKITSNLKIYIKLKKIISINIKIPQDESDKIYSLLLRNENYRNSVLNSKKKYEKIFHIENFNDKDIDIENQDVFNKFVLDIRHIY